MIQMGKLRPREELKISQGNIFGQWQSQDKNQNLQNQGPEACLFPTIKEKAQIQEWLVFTQWIYYQGSSFFLFFSPVLSKPNLAYFNLNRNNSKGRVGSGEVAHWKKNGAAHSP